MHWRTTDRAIALDVNMKLSEIVALLPHRTKHQIHMLRHRNGIKRLCAVKRIGDLFDKGFSRKEIADMTQLGESHVQRQIAAHIKLSGESLK